MPPTPEFWQLPNGTNVDFVITEPMPVEPWMEDPAFMFQAPIITITPLPPRPEMPMVPPLPVDFDYEDEDDLEELYDEIEELMEDYEEDYEDWLELAEEEDPFTTWEFAEQLEEISERYD